MSQLPKYAIEVTNIKKIYQNSKNKKIALDNFSLKIRRGSFCALLGPNGAGKSTFINILAGLSIKTSGIVRIWNYDIESSMRLARSSIGIVPQELNLDAFFTPYQIMELQAGLYGIPKTKRKTNEILSALNLLDKANAYSRSLSGGMRRRLLVGKAMVHRPPILVLDEPTAGVDIELRQKLWIYLKKLNQSGVTIVLTTHYLEEAEELCDEIAIINQGSLIVHDEKHRLMNKIDHKILILTLNTPLKIVPKELSSWGGHLIDSYHIALHYYKSKHKISDILEKIYHLQLNIIDLSIKESDLSDIFLMLTRNHNKDNLITKKHL